MTQTKRLQLLGPEAAIQQLRVPELSEPERRLLELLSGRTTVSLDDALASFDQAPDSGNAIQRLIARGLVYLEAIEYPWGVELQLCLTKTDSTRRGTHEQTQPALKPLALASLRQRDVGPQ